MIVAIHQPNYLPYLGFFRKMSLAEVLILYDTAQFSKNDFNNRNRIKTPRGSMWLTVPVQRSGLIPIRDVEIARQQQWALRHLKTLEANYRRATYYDSYSEVLSEILKRDWSRLAELNGELIRRIGLWLSLKTKVVAASDLPPPPTEDPTEKLLHLTEAVGGDVYLSGPGGRDYLDTTKFKAVGLEFSDFNAKPYKQLHGRFIPNLSAVDALFNLGAAASRTIG